MTATVLERERAAAQHYAGCDLIALARGLPRETAGHGTEQVRVDAVFLDALVHALKTSESGKLVAHGAKVTVELSHDGIPIVTIVVNKDRVDGPPAHALVTVNGGIVYAAPPPRWADL